MTAISPRLLPSLVCNSACMYSLIYIDVHIFNYVCNFFCFRYDATLPPSPLLIVAGFPVSLPRFYLAPPACGSSYALPFILFFKVVLNSVCFVTSFSFNITTFFMFYTYWFHYIVLLLFWIRFIYEFVIFLITAFRFIPVFRLVFPICTI
jgi:hypothetical protein